MAPIVSLIYLLGGFVLACNCISPSTFYIAPNITACNGTENCTTLEDYAYALPSDPSLQLKLIFLPGKHILNLFLFIESGTYVLLTGSSDSCSLTGDCPLITSTNKSGTTIQIKNVDNTVFQNLHFVNISILVKPSVFFFADMVNYVEITNCSLSLYGQLAVFNSYAIIGDCIFKDTIANYTSQFIFSTVYFIGNTTFANNTHYFSALYLLGTKAWFHGTSVFYNNSGKIGGSLYIFNCTVTFNGSTTFSSNIYTLPGALYSHDSAVIFGGDTVFVNNKAKRAGAIAAVHGSRIINVGKLSFINNTANFDGGGLYLEGDSLLYMLEFTNTTFMMNKAGSSGGAIYIDNPKSCFSTLKICFFQVVAIKANLTFINNFAISGADIFGGNIDECITIGNESSGDVFDRITTIHHDSVTHSSISSDAIKVCNCINGIPDCLLTPKCYEIPLQSCPIPCSAEYCRLNRTLFPGENVSISVIAVGQRDGSVPTVIRAVQNDNEIAEGQYDFNQFSNSNNEDLISINGSCTNINIPVLYSSVETIFTLYPKTDSCLNKNEYLPIALKFNFPCPNGFDFDNLTLICSCAQRLQRIGGIICSISDQTFHHRGQHWIGYVNTSNDLIIHTLHCPFGYCHMKEEVTFTLDDTDKQCSYNRSGLLCGSCREGLSIQLGGTVKCDYCSNYYLTLLIPFALAGVILVVVLFICELTVTAGTLSGLIFYANIVQINRSLFFEPEWSFPSMIIAWLNLDLGINTCFYDGMDSYGYTWLQFLFPFYIWTILGLIIVLSRYSWRVTKLLGSHPIAVLDTLFLLSYVKILRVFITSVAYTSLQYQSKSVVVWQMDGNVEYLEGKHIFLFLFALITFIILFVPFTALLLFGQWFQAKSNWKVLSWAKSQRFRAFLDVYHAPYKYKHRYWPGLLLVFRIVIATSNALANASSRESLETVNFTVIVTVLVTLLWGWSAGGLYKNWLIDVLEAFFFVNLGLLVFSTYYIEYSGGRQEGATNFLVSFALIVFAGIMLYHIVVFRLKLKWKSIKNLIENIKNKIIPEDLQAIENSDDNNELSRAAITMSYVTFREDLMDDNGT